MSLKQLGPYRIAGVLGRGGMGAVYAGTDEQTGKRAAVKVLSAAYFDDENFRQRFAAEVETLKKLKHPNIVELFGYGEQDGQLFYAMELVEGRSLQDELLAGRRFEWREVARFGIDVCAALKHAHDRGVIHRDLKPANLLLAPNGHVKLSDFGIAKLFGVSHLTSDGSVLGTADYMAPEQAEGLAATARSDMYSLGSVLYALLTSRPPFASKTLPEVLHRLRFEAPPPITSLAPDAPRELVEIIERLLHKDAQQRIATPLALAKQLEAMLAETDEPLPPAGDSQHDDDFVVSDQPPAPGANDGVKAPSTSSIRPTVLLPAAEGNAGAQQSPPRDNLQVAAETVVRTGAQAHDDALRLEPPAAPPPAATHFKTVTADERRRALGAADDDDDRGHGWLALGLLALLVVALGFGAWYFLRPSSADVLYGRIVAAGETGEPQRLMDVASEVNEFLKRFPADQRAGEVRQYQEDLELYQLQRRFELQARRRGGARGLSPVQQLYLDAIHLAPTAPETAAAKLQSLIDVFSGVEDDADVKQCVALARRQLVNLQAAIAQSSQQHLSRLRERLERADRLRESDPEAAAAIWRGIRELYADKPWAAEVVQHASEALGEPN
jgi:serine/threonine protein kinase